MNKLFKHRFVNLIGHKRSNGASDLFELCRVSGRAEQQKEEARRDRHFSEVTEQLGLLQTDEGSDMVAKEVHLKRSKISVNGISHRTDH